MAEDLCILIVDDEPIVHETLGGFLRDNGHQVLSCTDPRDVDDTFREATIDLALIDLKMPQLDGMSLLGNLVRDYPDVPVVMITGHGNMETVIEALRRGAADFLDKPVRLLDLEAVVEKCARLRSLYRQRQRLQDTVRGLQDNETDRYHGRYMVGVSEATAELHRLIRQAVEADCGTLLVTGETGVGKEMVAREFHYQRHSSDAPFITVSCPAISDTMVDSEFFGHIRGAFPGAMASRAGCFELADGGTLFLDEIGDLSPAAQAKLLRVLETRQVRRVGSTRELQVNVNVVAATNARLQELVKANRFRRDLYYRLNVFAIHVLPLRDRTDDILPIAEYVLETFNRQRNQANQTFSAAAADQLAAYPFPGNARELRNIVERAAILSGGKTIDLQHLHLVEDVPATPPRSTADDAPAGRGDRQRILDALQQTKWNRRRASELLDMPYSTLRYKIKKYGLR